MNTPVKTINQNKQYLVPKNKHPPHPPATPQKTAFCLAYQAKTPFLTPTLPL